MRKIRKYIAFIAIIASALIAFGLFSLPKPMAADSGSFSAERVYDDLKFISKEHHSIEHPVERERVRSYYYDRLSEIGCNPEIIRYDSITLYKGIPVNIANIYCEIPPLTAN